MKWLEWFKRIVQQLRGVETPHQQYETLKLQYKDQSSIKPNRKQCAELLRLLDPEQYRQYSPHYGRSIMLSAETQNLETFTKKLQDTSAMVIRDARIPNDWVKTDEVAVAFDRLFVSNDGYYMEVAPMVAKFKVAAVRLCELMEGSDNATHGIHEHNFRVLTRLFVQLREISTSMLEVSLQQ